jgi:hypothetical protein
MKLAGKNINIVTFGILGFLVLLISYYFGSRTGKAKSTAIEVDTLAKDIKGNELTYDLSEYNSLADRAFIAVYDIGSDEEALYVILAKMRNNSDIYQLIKTFGSRGGFFQGGSKTLSEWIASDLNNVEIEKVNEILKRNGITFQF